MPNPPATSSVAKPWAKLLRPRAACTASSLEGPYEASTASTTSNASPSAAASSGSSGAEILGDLTVAA